MKSRITFLFLALSLVSVVAARAEQYSVDPVHSTAIFNVQHLGAGNTYGVFTDLAGSVSFDPAKPEDASVEIGIKTASVNTFNEARDKHLSNADFFDVEKHPEMSFKSTAWKKTGEKTFEISGDFTLHGVTKPLTVTATHTGSGKGRKGEALIGFEASFAIKRSDYGMGGMVPAVGDEVRITIAIEAVAPKES